MAEQLKDQEANEQAENIEIEPLSDEEMESVDGGATNEREFQGDAICSVTLCS